MRLANRRILLGVTGSVAAYKAAELIRLLRAAGAETEVVLTRGGAAFITPMTLQALAGRAVHTSHLDPVAESAMGHIELARWSELVLIAPASANVIARLAAGLADDLLTMLCLATASPLAIAPAMNRQMWEHPATRDNIARLRERGVHVLGPEVGEQACGEIGPGRMLEPALIEAELARLFAQGRFDQSVSDGRRLEGRCVLITAGPTQEPIDPVRYVSNRSSGRMGHALARAAAAQGARVVLVSGPVSLPAPPDVERIAVRSADEMAAAVRSAWRPATSSSRPRRWPIIDRSPPPRKRSRKRPKPSASTWSVRRTSWPKWERWRGRRSRSASPRKPRTWNATRWPSCAPSVWT